jgi:hypothetical protein
MLGGGLHLACPEFGHHDSDCCHAAVDLVPSPISGHHHTSIEAGQASDSHDPANCPICQYLAQGKIVAERVEAVAVASCEQSVVFSLPQFAPSLTLRSFQSRAPPVV